MVRKIVLSLAAVLSVVGMAMAQNKQVSGTVTDTKGAPVIVDYNPTFYNLVGKMEYENEI